MSFLFDQIEFTDDGEKNRWYRVRPFVRAHPDLAGSLAALRKRLQFREINGLEADGVVRETKLGLLISPERYRRWLERPRVSREDAA